MGDLGLTASRCYYREGGAVAWAGWTFWWHIPNPNGKLRGSGLHIFWAYFHGKPVLFHGSQPFSLANYFGQDGEMPLKDGLGPVKGAEYIPVAPYAIPTNANLTEGFILKDVKGWGPERIALVEKFEPGDFTQASVRISAKFQVENYQYIQVWEFRSDGSVHISVGLGGILLGAHAGGSALNQFIRASHVHNFYFRLTFAFAAKQQIAEVLSLPVVTAKTPGDGTTLWNAIASEGPVVFVPTADTRIRVRGPDAVSRCSNPRLNPIPSSKILFSGYELRPGKYVPPDGTFSTADAWVFKRSVPNTEEMGEEATQSDAALTEQYGGDVLAGGENLTIWYCLRELHTPRWCAEESQAVPYEFVSFELVPFGAWTVQTDCLYLDHPHKVGDCLDFGLEFDTTKYPSFIPDNFVAASCDQPITDPVLK